MAPALPVWVGPDGGSPPTFRLWAGRAAHHGQPSWRIQFCKACACAFSCRASAARSPASDRTPDTAAPRAYTAGPDTSCSLPLQTSFVRACKIKPCPEVSGKAGEAHTLSIHPRSQTDPVLTPAARLVSPEGQLRIGVVGPDLAPDLFQERGKGQQFGAGRSSPQVCSETSQQAWPLERVSMRLAARPAPRQRRR